MKLEYNLSTIEVIIIVIIIIIIIVISFAFLTLIETEIKDQNLKYLVVKQEILELSNKGKQTIHELLYIGNHNC